MTEKRAIQKMVVFIEKYKDCPGYFTLYRALEEARRLALEEAKELDNRPAVTMREADLADWKEHKEEFKKWWKAKEKPIPCECQHWDKKYGCMIDRLHNGVCYQKKHTAPASLVEELTKFISYELRVAATQEHKEARGFEQGLKQVQKIVSRYRPAPQVAEMKLPWKRGNTGEDQFMFLNSDDDYCGAVQIRQFQGRGSYDEQRRINCGEFILKAVNAYRPTPTEDIVGELKRCLDHAHPTIYEDKYCEKWWAGYDSKEAEIREIVRKHEEGENDQD